MSEPAEDSHSTSHPSANTSLEAACLWGFQYRYCQDCLLIKTNSVLLVATQGLK